MPLVKYDRETGAIVALIAASTESLLQAQIPPDDARHGYLLTTEERAPHVWQEQYVVQEGALQAKAVVTLHATPNPFPADGQTECQITIQPCAPCTVVLMPGLRFALTPDDPVLVLTADRPQTWTVQLDACGAVMAEPLTVEAV